MTNPLLTEYQKAIDVSLKDRQKALAYYSRLNKWLSIPSIVIGSVSITTLASSFGVSSYQVPFQITSVCLSTISVVMSSVHKFLQVNDKITELKKDIGSLKRMRMKMISIIHTKNMEEFEHIKKSFDDLGSATSDVDIAEIQLERKSASSSPSQDEVVIPLERE